MKAPRWLTESFAEGIDERELVIEDMSEACWLAQFDRAQRPCEERFERFHYLSRQRVEHALGALLPQPDPSGCVECAICLGHSSSVMPCPLCGGYGVDFDPTVITLLAAWDCRNGGIACELHHRRFDKHLVSLPSEQIVVPRSALPEHVEEFAADWGLEDELEARFDG